MFVCVCVVVCICKYIVCVCVYIFVIFPLPLSAINKGEKCRKHVVLHASVRPVHELSPVPRQLSYPGNQRGQHECGT